MAKPPRRRTPTARTYERTDRVAELLREIVAEELRRLDDDRLLLLTVTAVDVDRELEKARVYYTTLDGDEENPEVVEALDEQRGRVRHAIGKQARLRRTPEIVFVPDHVQRSAERIEAILHDLDLGGDEPGDGEG